MGELSLAPPKGGRGSSLRSRRLQVVGTRKNGRARITPCVSPSRAPVLSFARYFQAPATQANAAV